MKSWEEVVESLRPEMKGQEPEQIRKRKAANEFLNFVAERLITPEEPPERALALFEKEGLEAHRRADGKLNKQGETSLAMAKRIVQLVRGDAPEAEQEADAEQEQEIEQEAEADLDAHTAPQNQPMKPSMTKHRMSPPQQEEEFNEEEFLMEEEPMEEVVEEEPPAPRPPPRIPAPHRRARRPTPERAQPRSGFRDLMPRSEHVRIYKRDEVGKRMLIDDYSLEDIGSMPLINFVKEYIHPEFGNEGSPTKYEFYELDPRSGREKNPPGSTTLAPLQAGQPGGPMEQLRTAMSMVNEVQQMTTAAQPSRHPMLEMAQQQAVKTGDMNGLMMVMMMEKMMGGGNQQAELVMKLMDRLDKLEGRSKKSEPEFGPPPPWGFPPPPPPFAPPFHQEDKPTRQSEKLVDLALAKLVNPTTLADQLKELMALQNFMQPRSGEGSEVAALRSELRGLIEKVSNRSNGGLEDSVANFEKLVTAVKSIAPQVGGNDNTGFLKGLLSTPELGKTVGNFVAQMTGANKPQPMTTAPTVTVSPQHVQQAPAQPAVRDPNQPPNPPPQAVLDAVRVFRFAQTPEVQAQRFVDLALAMYTSDDPFYLSLLKPALENMNLAEEGPHRLKVPRETAMGILLQLKPSLATPEFVDACLAALANRAGVEKLPDSLIATRGKWVWRDGEARLLEEFGARPVSVNGASPATAQPEVVPEKKAEEAPSPAPTPVPAPIAAA